MSSNNAMPSMILPLASSPATSDDASYDSSPNRSPGRTEPEVKAVATVVPVSDTDKQPAASAKPSGIDWRQAFLKYGSFIILVVNHTGFTMMLRASKTASGPRYISSTAVAMMEVAKVVFSLLMLVLGNGSRTVNTLYEGLVKQPKYLLILSVPSFLYVVQNNLLYIALDNLDAVVYLLCKQLKLLSTAFLSVLMLKKYLRWQQWVALLMLTAGVGMVQLSKMKEKQDDESPDNPMIGLLAVLACVVLSGYSGVYFEKVLKKGGKKNKDGKAPDAAGADGLWMRNIQMSASSVPIAIASAFAKDYNKIDHDGFFHGWTNLVIGVVMLQAVGGLLNSVVVNYMDNIIKGFASSYCILTTLLMEMLLFNFKPNLVFTGGALMVVVSSIVYGKYGAKKKKSAVQATPVTLTTPDQEEAKKENLKQPLL